MSPRILTFSPQAEAIIVALGAADRLVSHDVESASVCDSATLAGLLAEADNVVLDRDDHGAIERVGMHMSSPPLLVGARTTAELDTDIDNLGELTGLGDRAERVRMQLRVDLNSVSRAVAGGARPTVLVVSPARPLSILGGWVAEAVGRAGGSQALADDKLSVAPFAVEASPREVAEMAPDVLVFCLPVANGDLDIEGLNATEFEALEDAGCRIVTAPSGVYDLRVTPQSLVRGARRMAAAIHPTRVAAPAV